MVEHRSYLIGVTIEMVQIGGLAAVRSGHGIEWALKFPTSRSPKASDDPRGGSAR